MRMVVAAVLSCGLASLFVASAFAKMTYWADTIDWFAELLPRLRQPFGTRAVVAAEIAIAVAAVGVPRAGGIAAAAWLLVASAVLVAARRRSAGCGCFGLRQRLGAGVAIRNGTSILLALTTAAIANPAIELLPVAAVVGSTVVVLREAVGRKGATA